MGEDDDLKNRILETIPKGNARYGIEAATIFDLLREWIK